MAATAAMTDIQSPSVVRPPATAATVTTIHARPRRTWGLSVSGTTVRGSRSAAPRRSPFVRASGEGSGTGPGLVSLANEPSRSGGRNHPDGERSDSGWVNGNGTSSGSRGPAFADLVALSAYKSAIAASDPPDT